MHDAEQDISEFELVPLANGMAVFEIEFGPVVYLRSGNVGQLNGADDVVFVAVCFEDMGDPAALAARNIEINADVASRVDDKCLAVVTGDIGQMCDSGRVDGFEKHQFDSL